MESILLAVLALVFLISAIGWIKSASKLRQTEENVVLAGIYGRLAKLERFAHDTKVKEKKKETE